jgi:hypothetical protein
MDKINLLLNENTIIDFGLLWRLTKRYRSHLLLAFFFFAIFLSYNYYTQPIVYAVNLPIKALNTHNVETSSFQKLQSEEALSLSLNELKISTESNSFLISLAESVIKDSEYEKVNFGAFATKNSIYGNEIHIQCQNLKKCEVEILINQLRQLFTVEQGVTENRFIIIVKAVNKDSAMFITKHLTSAVEQNRVKVRQYQITKELESVNGLISESRNLIETAGGFSVLEEQEKLANNINELKEKVRILQQNLSIELANVSSTESKLNENKKTMNSSFGVGSTEVETLKKRQTRLLEVKNNIYVLSSTPEENRTEADNRIIAQLKEERKILLSLLPSDNKRSNIEVKDNFAASQRTKTDDIKLEYEVAKGKMTSIKNDLDQAKGELEDLLQKKISSENAVSGLKSDFEFLKNLEAKQMSLKIQNATMTPDLYFEDTQPNPSEYRQSSYLKIILFSLAISLFLHIFSIIIRFLYDDRIYNEDDLKAKFANLEFIGEVPKFG